MANYNAIGQVSDALVEVLQSSVSERDDVISLDRNEIVLSSPDDVGADSDVRISLYLYSVERSEQQQSRTVTADDVEKGRPLSMTLRYLLTAYPSMSGTSERTNVRYQHNTLGLAMQVLHDNAVLTQHDLGGSFREDTQITVEMEHDSESAVSRVWDSFGDLPRYPSAVYRVSPVRIDSLRETELHRVSRRQIDNRRKDL